MFRRAAALSVPLLASLLLTSAHARTILVPQEFWTVQAGVNSAGPGDTVLVHPRDYPEFVEIRAPGVIVRGSSGSPADVRVSAFTIRDTQDVRIENLTLTASGRCVWVEESDDVIISGVTMLGDRVDLGRRFSMFQSGSVLLEDCDFGSARVEIYTGPFTCTIRDSRFTGSTLLGNGGAIWVGNGSTLEVEGSEFHERQVSGDGGAIYCGDGSTASISRCTFVRNWASGSGGAVVAVNATVDLSNSILFGSVQGEGIACVGAASGVTVTHCILFGNSHGDAVCGTDGGNLVLDPKLCNPLDEEALGLCADSPALAGSPDNPWGEDVGALGQECLCTVSVDAASWGRIKGMYR